MRKRQAISLAAKCFVSTIWCLSHLRPACVGMQQPASGSLVLLCSADGCAVAVWAQSDLHITSTQPGRLYFTRSSTAADWSHDIGPKLTEIGLDTSGLFSTLQRIPWEVRLADGTRLPATIMIQAHVLALPYWVILFLLFLPEVKRAAGRVAIVNRRR